MFPQSSGIAALLAASTLALSAAAVAQSTSGKITAAQGFSVSVFARGVKGQYTAPDSIAVTKDRVYIGYGDDHDPAGADGKASQIVEYSKDGRLLYIYNVPGHNDGLKPDPLTGKIWAMQDEDGNPNLVILDPKTREQSLYIFASAPPHGGGYDDIVFRGGQVYFSASNPAHNPNTKPAIVKAQFSGSTIQVSPLLEGDAQATDVLTGQSVTLNLQDPDSMTLDPSGDVLLDSQADSEVIVVRKPGTKQQSALQVPLSSPYGTPQIDDTLFTPSGDGFMLVADTPANTIYRVQRTEFVPGVAYSAAVATDSAGASIGFVGRLDLEYGQLTPVVTGLQSPHGLGFVRTADVNSVQDQIDDLCQELGGN